MDGQSEQWRPVVGYESLYEVSDMGRVKRVGSGRGAMIGHILKPRPSFKYLRATLCGSDGKGRPHRVHKLVLAAFVGPRPKGYEIDHINIDKSDNRLSNLEYVTSTENKLRAYRTGVRTGPRGSTCGTSKLTETEVQKIKAATALSNRKLAQQFNVSESCIQFIRSGRSWNHVQAIPA